MPNLNKIRRASDLCSSTRNGNERKTIQINFRFNITNLEIFNQWYSM